jgi:hypothetical protein
VPRSPSIHAAVEAIISSPGAIISAPGAAHRGGSTGSLSPTHGARTLELVREGSLMLDVFLGGAAGSLFVWLPAPVYSLAYIAVETLALSLGPAGLS